MQLSKQQKKILITTVNVTMIAATLVLVVTQPAPPLYLEDIIFISIMHTLISYCFLTLHIFDSVNAGSLFATLVEITQAVGFPGKDTALDKALHISYAMALVPCTVFVVGGTPKEIGLLVTAWVSVAIQLARRFIPANLARIPEQYEWAFILGVAVLQSIAFPNDMVKVVHGQWRTLPTLIAGVIGLVSAWISFYKSQTQNPAVPANSVAIQV